MTDMIEPATEEQRAVVDGLLAFGRTDARAANATFAADREANAFLWSDPFAFLVGVIFNQSWDKQKAWRAPLELKKRLGHLDPRLIQADLSGVTAAIRGGGTDHLPALHRYIGAMSRAVVAAAAGVVSDYGGDASRIWSGVTSAHRLHERLEEFEGIGQKKAAMAVDILRHRNLVIISDTTDAQIAVDRHVIQVFIRAGLSRSGEVHAIVQAARFLNPDDPAALDYPAYLIGRQWCHTTPDCPKCAIRKSCMTGLQVGAEPERFQARAELYIEIEGLKRSETVDSFRTAITKMRRLMEYLGENLPGGAAEISVRMIRSQPPSGDADRTAPEATTIMQDLVRLLHERQNDPILRAEVFSELRSVADRLGGKLIDENNPR